MVDDKELEASLRRSLRQVPAPEGFADRVMTRVRQCEGAERRTAMGKSARTGVLLRIREHAVWWAGAAAVLLVMAGGGDALHLRHQRQLREAAAAQAQMDMAMQLTSHALGEVENGLDRSPAGRFAQLWNGTQQ